jgi:hypothetical protein
MDTVAYRFFSEDAKVKEVVMYEILALAAGVAVALMVQRLIALWSKVVVLAICSLAFGVLVSFVSGELSVSWAYLLFDAAQVLIAAGVTTVLMAWWRRRATQSP